MTIKTVKGRDLPDIQAGDKVRFVLVPDEQELEVFCYCKYTQNMCNGVITICLRPAEEKEQSE